MYLIENVQEEIPCTVLQQGIQEPPHICGRGDFIRNRTLNIQQRYQESPRMELLVGQLRLSHGVLFGDLPKMALRGFGVLTDRPSQSLKQERCVPSITKLGLHSRLTMSRLPTAAKAVLISSTVACT